MFFEVTTETEETSIKEYFIKCQSIFGLMPVDKATFVISHRDLFGIVEREIELIVHIESEPDYIYTHSKLKLILKRSHEVTNLVEDIISKVSSLIPVSIIDRIPLYNEDEDIECLLLNGQELQQGQKVTIDKLPCILICWSKERLYYLLDESECELPNELKSIPIEKFPEIEVFLFQPDDLDESDI